MNYAFSVAKALVLVVVLAACTTMNFGIKNRIAFGYASVEAYVDQAISLKKRGRLTDEQKNIAVANARKAKAALDYAAGTSLSCPGTPCTPADQLRLAEGILLDLEKQLKEKEGIQ